MEFKELKYYIQSLNKLLNKVSNEELLSDIKSQKEKAINIAEKNNFLSLVVEDKLEDIQIDELIAMDIRANKKSFSFDIWFHFERIRGQESVLDLIFDRREELIQLWESNIKEYFSKIGMFDCRIFPDNGEVYFSIRRKIESVQEVQDIIQDIKEVRDYQKVEVEKLRNDISNIGQDEMLTRFENLIENRRVDVLLDGDFENNANGWTVLEEENPEERIRFDDIDLGREDEYELNEVLLNDLMEEEDI